MKIKKCISSCETQLINVKQCVSSCPIGMVVNKAKCIKDLKLFQIDNNISYIPIELNEAKDFINDYIIDFKEVNQTIKEDNFTVQIYSSPPFSDFFFLNIFLSYLTISCTVYNSIQMSWFVQQFIS